MQRASVVYRAGHWPADKGLAGWVVLDFQARHRRRILLTTHQGQDILLDLPRTIAMADGDALQLDDGSLIRVVAASELVLEVTHEDPGELMRVAWHLGNRHVTAEIRERLIRIRPDHVIGEMLLGLGAEVAVVRAAFQPEGSVQAHRGQSGKHGEHQLE